MEQIFGFIERITYHNVENGFTVAKLKQPKKNELTTIVGTFSALQPGESVRCLGSWKHSPTHGPQFEVAECFIEAPSDLLGIQKYLECGMIRGIGPVYAEKIVKKFGIQTLDIIDQDPERLMDIEGLGQKKIDTIKACWQSQKAIRSVMVFLQKYGVSPAFAQKVYKNYGDDAIEKLKENPFRLADDIAGVGFKSADTIASKMGFPHESATRIQSGIEYVLRELSEDGHVCYPKDELIVKSKEILGVDGPLIESALLALVGSERVMQEESMVWIKSLYLCEMGIARELKRLQEGVSTLRSIDLEKAIDWVQSALHIELAPTQKEAVKCSLVEKLHIITGGPGTGKSTITKAILAITEKLTPKILLAAPTGRAAKRMTEITRRAASTIHSLLQYDFSARGFKRGKDNPLICDLLIVDESSMIDTFLMYSLLRAVPTGCRVLFVGDIHQLPSVGPGNVLRDMIQSGTIPVTELTEIFRQAAGSKIILNAHKINQGEFPDLRNDARSDFFFCKGEDQQELVMEIVDLVTKRLPKRYRFDPINDIQVLSPMKKGQLGIENLNRVLQEALNPNKDYLFHGGLRVAAGDKIMQIRNDYDKEVYNGDIGRIKSISREEETVSVEFDGRTIPFAFHEMDSLTLAYATSIHKYQGSECPCVLIPCHMSHFIMLHRNLLYTGVTRGKKLVVLLGSPKAIAIATKNDGVKLRHTALKQKLELARSNSLTKSCAATTN